MSRNTDEQARTFYSNRRSSDFSGQQYRRQTDLNERHTSRYSIQHSMRTTNSPVDPGTISFNESNPNTTLKKEQKRRPWFIWTISVLQLCAFVAEIIYNGVLTSKPIETDLSRNPLFGPTAFILINMGACFSPCMHSIDGITNNISSTNFPCPNTTSSTSNGCTLSDLCGFNGVSDSPNQWFRFILPLFLHAGIVHILLNLIAQILIGGKIERTIGVVRTVIIYFTSGIFGFIFGGNFSAEGLTRVGCSGAVFSLIALSLLDILYHWKSIKYPKLQLICHLFDIIVNLVLGLLPGIDNFSHLGGFAFGLLLGLTLLGSPMNLRRRETKRTANQTNSNRKNLGCCRKFVHNRPKHWWTWWLVRFIALTVTVTAFVLLTENFYSRRMKCSWCKYINCLPVNQWCDIGVLPGRNL